MDVNTVLLLIATVITIGFIANVIFRRTEIPDLIWLLLLGILIGPVFHVVNSSVFNLIIPYVSALALLLILFDAGVNIKLSALVRKVPLSSSLAFFGFILSMLTVAAVALLVLPLLPGIHLSIEAALLLGAIVGGVSSTMVIPTVALIKSVGQETALTLDIESIITDPLVIIVSLGILNILTGLTGISAGEAVQEVISTFSVSLVIGFIAGLVWLLILRYIKQERYTYMMTLGFLFFVYPMVELLKGNGAVASFIIGVVLGNGKAFSELFKGSVWSFTRTAKYFHSEVSFFIKTFLFVFMGAMITLNRIELFLFGFLLSLLLLGVRWLFIQVLTIRSHISAREKKLMVFLYPRGLSAAVLISILYVSNVAALGVFTEIVFSVILCTAVIATAGLFYIEHEHKKDKSDKSYKPSSEDESKRKNKERNQEST